MRVLWRLATAGAIFCGLAAQLESRALPNPRSDLAHHLSSWASGPLTSRFIIDQPAPVQIDDYIEKRKTLLVTRTPGSGIRIGKHDDDGPQGTSNSGGGTNEGDSQGGPADPHSAPPRIAAEGDGDSGGASGSPTRIASEDNSENVNPGGTKPEDVNVPLPGNTVGDSIDYDQLKTGGLNVDEELRKRINDKAPDIEEVNLEDNYRIEDKSDDVFDEHAESDLVQPFKDLDIPSDGAKYTDQQVWSKNADPNDHDAIAQSMYFGEAGVIVGGARFARNDINEADAQIKSSDLIFLQWEQIAGKTGNVKGLKGFIGRTIMSKSTLETMQTAQKNSGIPLNQVAVFKRSDTGVNKDGFYAMLGTQFAKSINNMLMNHHNALGDKTTSEVRCYPPTKDQTTGEGDDDFTILLRFDGPQ